jgi:hypothetical protein
VDQFGRPANSFQYFIVGNPSLPYPEDYDAIIRGEEIHITSDMLRIRNAVGSDPDPNSGGWGPIRGSVPFSLNDNVLTFSAPLHLVSDHSVDGHFVYEVDAYEFGALTNYFFDQSTVISEPSTALLLALATLCVSGWSCRRKPGIWLWLTQLLVGAVMLRLTSVAHPPSEWNVFAQGPAQPAEPHSPA